MSFPVSCRRETSTGFHIEDVQRTLISTFRSKVQGREHQPRLADVRDRRTGVVRHARDDLSGRLKDPDKVLLQLGRLKERYRKAWGYVKISFEDLRLSWRWDRHALRLAASRDGAYLFALTWTVAIRPNFGPNTSSLPKFTEVQAVFRALKSDLAIRPIWPGTQIRPADARCRLLDNNSGNRNKKRPVSQILESSTAKQNACGRAVR